MRIRHKEEEVFKRILAVARQEFIERGVKKASIRHIAQLSGVALGSIYKYVESKDELLRLVLSPLLDALSGYADLYGTDGKQSLEIFSAYTNPKATIQEISHIMRLYRAEMKLLLFDTAGTSLQDFMARFNDRMASISIRYLKSMGQKYPELKTDFSPLLMRIVNSGWNAVLLELSLHAELDDREIEDIISGYISFCKGGWKGLMNVNIE